MINSGDTAFVLICAALVCVMTPGLAFFYGGLVRRKNVLTIMMQSFISMKACGVSPSDAGMSCRIRTYAVSPTFKMKHFTISVVMKDLLTLPTPRSSWAQAFAAPAGMEMTDPCKRLLVLSLILTIPSFCEISAVYYGFLINKIPKECQLNKGCFFCGTNHSTKNASSRSSAH